MEPLLSCMLSHKRNRRIHTALNPAARFACAFCARHARKGNLHGNSSRNNSYAYNNDSSSNYSYTPSNSSTGNASSSVPSGSAGKSTAPKPPAPVYSPYEPFNSTAGEWRNTSSSPAAPSPGKAAKPTTLVNYNPNTGVISGNSEDELNFFQEIFKAMLDAVSDKGEKGSDRVKYRDSQGNVTYVTPYKPGQSYDYTPEELLWNTFDELKEKVQGWGMPTFNWGAWEGINSEVSSNNSIRLPEFGAPTTEYFYGSDAEDKLASMANEPWINAGGIVVSAYAVYKATKTPVDAKMAYAGIVGIPKGIADTTITTYNYLDAKNRYNRTGGFGVMTQGFPLTVGPFSIPMDLTQIVELPDIPIVNYNPYTGF